MKLEPKVIAPQNGAVNRPLSMASLKPFRREGEQTEPDSCQHTSWVGRSRALARKHENTGFECARCRARVLPLSNGSYRNHCPFCLWSLHVDARKPGDRASVCCGLMKPVAVVRKHGVLQVIHRCTACGKSQPNRVARDTEQPDDFERILALLQRGAPTR